MTPEAFATHWHGSQVRNIEHCREIVEILKGVPHTEDMLTAAWLHDVLEDTECGWFDMYMEFGDSVTVMVMKLTDCDQTHGNRAMRKKIDRRRLGYASADVQTIKLADLISIVEHDPNYLAEARMLLDVLVKGDESLRERLAILLSPSTKIL